MNAALTGHRGRQQPVAGNLVQVRTVDNHFRGRDPYRQDAADVPPRHRVQVLPIGNATFDVDRAVEHRRKVVGTGRQRNQMRLLQGVQFLRCFLGGLMNPDIGDLG